MLYEYTFTRVRVQLLAHKDRNARRIRGRAGVVPEGQRTRCRDGTSIGIIIREMPIRRQNEFNSTGRAYGGEIAASTRRELRRRVTGSDLSAGQSGR